MSFLFNEIVFGPVNSRRFGVSLGINLLPDNMKFCSFNCIYCECGLTDSEQDKHARLYSTNEILKALEERFHELHEKGLKPDNITFAGNGEPTMHPGFPEVIGKTISLRNQYFPEAKITVLSNSTRLGKEIVREALMLIDHNVLKLDAGSEEMYKVINRPLSPVTLNDIVSDISKFNGNVIIQTLLLRGKYKGVIVDNTTEKEINLWLAHLERIRPKLVMLYSISRETPEEGLSKISVDEMNIIAQKVRELNLEVEVY